jgi:hypothetical protein
MAYELRRCGHAAERFDTAAEAEARARDLVRADADLQVAIIDLATGRPYAPAADAAEREAMAKKVGY